MPAFAEEQCALLERLFAEELAEGEWAAGTEWQHRDGAFYRCSLRDVSAEIPATFQAAVLDRMREITGLPLVERVVVTAQRMLPGQVIGIHSDRPLLGYETARLVVQLNRGWQAEQGGVLELFSSPTSAVVASVTPEYNKAFGFLLHADSYHGVTEVSQPRQTVVFNFWHAANTPELAAHLQALFANAHFSELPVALNAVASAAEATLPEEVTFRAGTAALALVRWGYDDATIIAGYQYSAGLSDCVPLPAGTETYAAVRLADWVAGLHRDSFDLARWEVLRRELAGMTVVERLRAVWGVCGLGMSTRS